MSEVGEDVAQMWRIVNRWYAKALGYFWLPCPLCGRGFGGHEWPRRDGVPVTVPDPDRPNGGLGICPWCAEAGHGRP